MAIPILVANSPADSPHFRRANKVTGGTFGIFEIGVSIMRIDHPPHTKRSRRSEPSLWADESTDDALSLLGNALEGDGPTDCGDERTDETQALLEENARLRELLVQLSDLIRRNGFHPR
jgi:hypothetical protein